MSHNTANVTKMGRNLEDDNEENLKLITYGHSAYMMHLLAKDLNTTPGIKQNVEIAKYFSKNGDQVGIF